jgi:hypothetical protein
MRRKAAPKRVVALKSVVAAAARAGAPAVART